ncbi:MAG: glycosyltransferase family 2 protein, partial [Candidatus Parvarchaeum sp.]
MLFEFLPDYMTAVFTAINAIWTGSNIYNFYPLLKIRKLEKLEYTESKEKPRVSVLLPAYKEEKVLLNTVKKIENNKYSNLELILMTEKDDFKTDRMAEYLHRKYENVVHVPVKDNGKARGKPRALNQGLSKATGEIVGVLDAEDYISDDLFDKAASAIKGKGYDAVQGQL